MRNAGDEGGRGITWNMGARIQELSLGTPYQSYQKQIYVWTPSHPHAMKELPCELIQWRAATHKDYTETKEQLICNSASHIAQEENYHLFSFS